MEEKKKKMSRINKWKRKKKKLETWRSRRVNMSEQNWYREGLLD